VTASKGWPSTEHVQLEQLGPVLHVTLDRPAVRNAMSGQMVDELLATSERLRDGSGVRVVVLKGSHHTFCAGADLKDMLATAASAGDDGGPDPWLVANERAGELYGALDAIPQVVIAVVEGIAMGGGFGFVCVSDVALAHAEARFAMPEVGVGLPPAQISPYVVARIGAAQARRLALTGERFDAEEAHRIGLVHHVATTMEALDALEAETIGRALRCAPGAVAATKQLLRNPTRDIHDLAESFAGALRGPEGSEGVAAFGEKRRPSWAVDP
jgi:isohexenylglutaconyl-CoA hydratase